MIFIIMLIIVFLSFALGMAYEKKQASKRKTIFGSLHVETSDPDGPYLFLELETGIDAVMKEEIVSFMVDLKSYVTGA